jgi:hypothetical protein
MKNILYIFALVMVGLMLSGWGSKGHKKISQNMAPCLPAEMSFLSPRMPITGKTRIRTNRQGII